MVIRHLCNQLLCPVQETPKLWEAVWRMMCADVSICQALIMLRVHLVQSSINHCRAAPCSLLVCTTDCVLQPLAALSRCLTCADIRPQALTGLLYIAIMALPASCEIF